MPPPIARDRFRSRIPAGGDTYSLEPQDDEDDDDQVRARVVAGVERCLRGLLVAIGRDYRHCGKAACARSRRCRGFACEPDVADQR
jgi:hypothetical protein